MPKPDVTKLGWFDRTIDGCIVDSIPAGDAPKFVKVVLPGTDGSIIPVWWTGFPALAVSDTVSVRYSPGNAAQYVISGTSGATVSNGGGGWPAAGKAMINSTEYDSIVDAITASAAGDIIKLGQGTFAENLSLNKAVSLVGIDPLRTIITDSTSGDATIDITSDSAKVSGVTIAHTGAGTTAGCVATDNANVILENCILVKSSGAASVAYGFWMYGAGSARLTNCHISVTAGTVKRGLMTTLGAGAVTVEGGYISGDTRDLYTDQAGAVFTLVNAQLANGGIDCVGTLRGFATDDKGRDCGAVVKNTSGADRGRGSIGYVDSAGEFKTTTTANDNVAWNILTVATASSSYGFAKNKGNATVLYTGTAPSAGHWLVTSTTAAQAQRQTTMRPEIFAVCTAAGSGGSVEVLLLCNRKTVSAPNSSFLFAYSSGGNKMSTRDFVATLNGAANNVAKTFVYNAPSSGHENNLDLRAACTEQAIYNTTRSQTAWISSCNVGTNTVTCTSDSDLSAWANGDTVNIRSTVVVSGSSYYFGEFRFNSTANKPALATHVMMTLNANDTDVTQARFLTVHPYETFASSKQILQFTQVTSITNSMGLVFLPIIDGYIDVSWVCNATSGQMFASLQGWIVAEP